MTPMDPGAGVGLGEAVSNAPTWVQWITGGGMTALILGLLGFVVKRNRSSANLEDATNDVTVETVKSQRDRINELTTQLRESMQRELAAVQAQIQAEGNAARSALQAERASRAAAEASHAAVTARAEAEQARTRLESHRTYIAHLRQLLSANNVEVPPLPE